MKKLYLFLLLLIIGVISCTKEGPTDPPVTQPILPTVTTANPIPTKTTATTGGDVISDGNAQVTVRGVVWDTNPNPTISNNKTVDGIGTGKYTSNISGLNPNTTYYIKAYATNSVGTSYGQTVSFTTRSLQIGDLYQGKTIFFFSSPNHGLTFETLPRDTLKNWEDSKSLAASKSGRLATTQELINYLFPKKGAFGLNAQVYWSSEEALDDSRFALSVVFNFPSKPEYEGREVHSLKTFINSVIIVYSF